MFQDLLLLMKRPSSWLYMGWCDVLMRYRRTFLGPFWSVLTVAVFISMMGFVTSTLFNQDLSKLFPFITVGILTWTFISQLITETTSLFIAHAGSVANIPNSPLVYVLRLFVKAFILFLHNLLFFALIAFYFQTGIHASMFWLPFSLLLYFLTAASMGILLGFLCTRFRDVMQLVLSLMSVVLFVTPVMWKPELLGTRGWVAMYNPLFHYIELIRAPLLGYELTSSTLWATTLTTLVMCASASFLYNRYRYRLAYWV